jgi:predicted TIM-barrel enzyme
MPASTTTAPTASLFERKPLVVGALHLPDLRARRALTMAELERFLLVNVEAFAAGGIPALMIQDQTREPGPAGSETIAIMAALVRLARREFPALSYGVIVQAHDAEAPLVIAQASGADFVRLKVFVGSSMTAEGPRDALGPSARNVRHALGRAHIAVLADVHDRTSVPIGDVPVERAALWAEGLGADALVLTGSSFADSLERVRAARRAGVKRPILIGGGVDASNIAAALAEAQGVIVSRSLMADGASDAAPRWDAARVRALMAAAR